MFENTLKTSNIFDFSKCHWIFDTSKFHYFFDISWIFKFSNNVYRLAQLLEFLVHWCGSIFLWRQVDSSRPEGLFLSCHLWIEEFQQRDWNFVGRSGKKIHKDERHQQLGLNSFPERFKLFGWCAQIVQMCEWKMPWQQCLYMQSWVLSTRRFWTSDPLWGR